MKWKVGEIKSKGLKCDTKGCDYRDDSIEGKDYHKWVNATCPKCGHSLLTPNDFAFIKKLERRMLIANIICAPFVIVGNMFSKKHKDQYDHVASFGKENDQWVMKGIK
jgi:hypothetical protein